MTLDDFIDSRQQQLIEFRAWCIRNNDDQCRDEPDWENDFVIFMEDIHEPSMLMGELDPETMEFVE
jgi:hypothetical protein